MRQTIHSHPEPGLQEFKTSKLIKDRLLSFGIPEENIKPCAQTGWVVDIEGTSDNPPQGLSCVAIRADIDGLPIVEENEFSYKSQNPGMHHACGHDGHTTTVTSLAQVLAKNRDKIPRG